MLGKSNNNNLTNVTRKNAASISELINEIEIATPRGYLNRETQSLILNKNIILNKYNNSLNISHLREVRKKYEDSFWKVKSFKTELQWSVFIDLSKISSIGIASTPKNIEDYFHEDLQTITFVSRSTLKGIKTKTEYLEVNNSSFSFPGREYSKTDLHEKQIHEMYLSGAKLDIEQFVQSFNQVLKEIKNH
jgi:carbonic anhydrase